MRQNLEDPCPLQIKSDSAWFLAGTASILLGYEANYSWDYGDFWGELEEAIVEHLQRHPIRLRKVKGHATQQHVEEGLLTQEERMGNVEADLYADEGAEAHFDSDPSQEQLRQEVAEARERQAKHLIMAARIFMDREKRRAELAAKLRKDAEAA